MTSMGLPWVRWLGRRIGGDALAADGVAAGDAAVLVQGNEAGDAVAGAGDGPAVVVRTRRRAAVGVDGDALEPALYLCRGGARREERLVGHGGRGLVAAITPAVAVPDLVHRPVAHLTEAVHVVPGVG